MERRPILFSLTGMHESGLRMLREAGELRMASALDPATLQREVVGADALDHPHRRRDRRAHCSMRARASRSWAGTASATTRSTSMRRPPAASRSSTRREPTRRASPSTSSRLMIGLSKHFPKMTAELIAYNYQRPDQHDRPRHRRQDDRHRRLRADRPPGRRDRPSGLRHERAATTTSSPRPRRSSAAAAHGAWSCPSCSSASDYVTLHVPLDAEHPGPDQSTVPGLDASRRDPDQHLPRAGRR